MDVFTASFEKISPDHSRPVSRDDLKTRRKHIPVDSDAASLPHTVFKPPLLTSLCASSIDGKGNRYNQAAIRCIGRGNLPAVPPDCRTGD